MCMGGSTPAAQTPAAAPPPPAEPAKAPVVDEAAASAQNTVGGNARGHRGLVNDLNTSIPGGTGSLFIPTS
jgi:hypothetical protein